MDDDVITYSLPDEATLAFAREHADDDAVSLLLRADKYPAVDMKAAVSQMEGRRKAIRKLPEWAANDAIVFPQGVSMEQCSSQFTAQYKARLALRLCSERGQMVDLTGGFGVDCYYIGKEFAHASYVERSSELCVIARHNLSALMEGHFSVHNEAAEDYLKLMAPADLIFIDPSRRNSRGGRTYAISDCKPDVSALRDLLVEKGGHVLIKLSPMFDWHEAVRQMDYVTEIHIISTANECKELLLVLSRVQSSELRITCVNDDEEFTCTAERRQTPLFTGTLRPGMYLYEPNASIQKAGVFSALCEHTGLRMIAQNSHLFVSEAKIAHSIGREFQIQAISSVNRKAVAEALGGASRANVSVRNFPLTALQLRQKLHLGDGGDHYLFGTTLQGGSHVVIICKKEG